jgi:protein SCO1/2
MNRRWFNSLAGIALVVLSMCARAGTDVPDSARAIALSQSVIGSLVHDYELTDSNGRTRRLVDYRGKPLLVNFVYTGCAQVCPITVGFLDKAIGEARRALGRDSFAVATIGFNLPFDTPQAMHAFAAQHGITDPKWDFLSPAPGTIEALTREFGFTWYATPKGFDHVTQVTVLDAAGRIYRQIYGDKFEVPMLIEPLKQLITGTPAPAGDWRALVEKVRLFCTVYDRSSGRYRLDYSVFVGMAIGLLILGAGVTSLLREWQTQRRARRA